MLSDTMLPSRRSAWILFASAITARGQGSGLYQQYCSNQNTGADYQGGKLAIDIYVHGGR